MRNTEDDEEWYPPTPPIYDVADKLIEINRDHYNDPTSLIHVAGKIRWKPEDKLVQIKWLYSENNQQPLTNRYYYQSDSDEEESCGSENDFMPPAHFGRILSPPRIELTTIEDMSPDTSEQHTITIMEPPSLNCQQRPRNLVEEYDDEDFEEPSLGEDAEVKSPLLDDIVSQMEAIEMSTTTSVSSTASEPTSEATSKPPKGPKSHEKPASSASMASMASITSAAVTKTSTATGSSEQNNNEKQRPSRPRTKTTIISLQQSQLQPSKAKSLTKKRSSSMPKNLNVSNNKVFSNTSSMVAAQGVQEQKSRHRTSSSHARIKIAHHTNSNHNNNNSYTSSSGEETTFSSTRSHPLQQQQRQEASESSSRLSKTRKVITTAATTTESRPKTTLAHGSSSGSKSKTSIYITNGPGLNGVPARRKNSRNSLSSNSSVSSQTTEDSSNSSMESSGSGGTSCTSKTNSSTNSRIFKHIRHPVAIADVMNPPEHYYESPYFAQWKMRKREERKLRERKSFLEQQMRRH